jgi:hypothetical protein
MVHRPGDGFDIRARRPVVVEEVHFRTDLPVDLAAASYAFAVPPSRPWSARHLAAYAANVGDGPVRGFVPCRS